jgi:hypothetical protein
MIKEKSLSFGPRLRIWNESQKERCLDPNSLYFNHLEYSFLLSRIEKRCLKLRSFLEGGDIE